MVLAEEPAAGAAPTVATPGGCDDSWHEDGKVTVDAQAGLTADERDAAVDGTARPKRQRWRTILAVLLIVVGCVLAPLAGVAVWARNQVTNTDRYVRTVAPLASDPAIQQAVADQITTQIFAYLDVRGLTNQAVDALAARGLRPRVADQLRGLAGPLASGIQSFVRTEVGTGVPSQAVAGAWVQGSTPGSPPSAAMTRRGRKCSQPTTCDSSASPESPAWRSCTIVPLPSGIRRTSTVVLPGVIGPSSQPQLNTMRVYGVISRYSPRAISRPVTLTR